MSLFCKTAYHLAALFNHRLSAGSVDAYLRAASPLSGSCFITDTLVGEGVEAFLKWCSTAGYAFATNQASLRQWIYDYQGCRIFGVKISNRGDLLSGDYARWEKVITYLLLKEYLRVKSWYYVPYYQVERKILQ